MSLSLPSFCILYRKHYLLKSFFLLVVSLFFQRLSAQTVIQSFAPLSGAPGTAVTITGSGFDATPTNNVVFFGATRAAITKASGTSLTVIAPYGASCQSITVTSNGFTAYSSASFSTTFAGGGALSADAFTPAGDYTTGESPYSAATGDFDGDGKPDIVSIDGGYPYTVSVFRNTSSGGTISFAKNGSLTPGVVPFDAAVGDVNGDGKLDLVVTNSGSALSYSISVFINTSTYGAISFAPGGVYETGGSPTSVCIRDLDLDGRPDIAVTNFISSSISVFRNTGSGGAVSFAPRQDYNTGSYPSGIAAGDLDRDGRPELAVTNSGSNTVYVFPNISTPGNISLGSSLYYGAGSNSGPNSIRIHDMDGDGASDIVVSNSSSGKVAVFRSLGNRVIAFAGRQEFSLPDAPGHMSIADLDGDSRPDLALSGNKLLVLRNNSTPGTVSFDQPEIINSSKQPDNITVADFDGDAMPELVTVSQSDSVISIFRNVVTGPNVMSFAPDTAASGATVTIKGTNFTNATAVSFGGKPAASFSVRSDSVITAVVGEGASGAIKVTTAIRSGMRIGFVHLPKPVVTSFTPVSGSRGTPVTITGTALAGATAVTFGGIPARAFTVMNDTSIVATAGEGASGNIGVTTPNGSGYTSGFTYITIGEPPVINSFAPSSGPVGTVVNINGANFNSNPAANIVYFGPVRAKVLSASSTQLTVSVPLGANCDPITVTANRLTGRTVKTFIVTFSGGSGFTDSSFKPCVYFATRMNPYHSIVCDLDGDGRPDIATASYPQASVLRNTSKNGVLSFDSKVDIQTGAGSHITAGDLDGDGKQDLVISTLYSDIIILKNLSSPGTLAFADTIILPAARRLNSAAVADLDGDGRPEIIAVTEDSPNIMVFWNISLNGVIAFAPPINIPTGRMPYDVKAGDLDGDGKADLVVAQYQDNNVSVFRNTSTVGNISFAARGILISGEHPWSTGVGDLDADGKPELFVASTTIYKNFVHVYKNNSTPGVIAFEPSKDYIGATSVKDAQMGDLDGDGKPDLASANGNPWYYASFYRNISNNNTIALDTPALRIELRDPLMNVTLADLNGDGKPDLSGAQYGASRVMVMENNIGEGLSPLISAFTPASAAADSIVAIKGKHFTGATAVSFGGMPAASFTVVSDSVITAVVGTGASGLLSVTVPNGTAALDGFTYIVPVPSITSLFPDSGASGAIINITGMHLSDVTAVNFGGVPAASFSVISDSLITAVVGAGASGSVAVSTLYDTVSLAGFIYMPPPAPVVTSFAPASGITGTIVKVSGSNFNTATQVLFGGVAAASFVVDSSTGITAIVGSGASGPVSVITGGGTSSLAGFTYVPPAPVVTSFTPTSAGTGTTVKISGSNFSDITLVSFGGVPATSFVVESPTSIAAVIGNGASGTVSITSSGGVSSLDGFIYKFPVPTITGFTPVSATTGDTVRITGSNLTGATEVLIGGVPAASFVVESSTVVVAVVASGASGKVSVTTAGGTATRAGFTYVPPTPVISSFTPLSAKKGDVVKISGNNFTSVMEVRFGGVRAASFVVDSSSGITAVVGNGSSGAVSVTNSSGNSSLDGFTFVSTTPDITSFTPVKATTGETVTISGVNFADVTEVWFGELPAASFNLGSSTSITAIVGNGTSGSVWVVANGDTAKLYGFTYTSPAPPAPVITVITPASAATGTVIKISGNNFTGATQVLLGGIPATSFTVDSSTSITAVVGNGASGAVTVVTPAGTSSYPGFVFIVPVAPYQPLVAFPNPVVNGILHVKHAASTKTSNVLLFDMNGAAILRIAVAPGDTQTDVNVGGLLPGMYQVIWTDEDQRLRQTIIVP